MEQFERLKKSAFPLQNFTRLNEHGQIATLEQDINQLIEDKAEQFQTFCTTIINLDDKLLNTVLEELDNIHRVDENDKITSEIVNATESLVNSILNKVAEIDPRFKASCINSGSYYDNLKIGQADEFDFVARIESLSVDGLFEARHTERKPGFVYLLVKSEEILERYAEFITQPDDDDCLQTGDKVFSVGYFQEYFVDLVSDAINSMQVPDFFVPNDADQQLRDRRWNPIKHGPCATLYAKYLCQSAQKIVELDIDIVPSIVHPDKSYKPLVTELLNDIYPENTFLETIQAICATSEILLVPFKFDYIKQSDVAAWTYFYSDTWRVSHSNIEKAVFALFCPLSVEKKLCRVLKIVKEMYLQDTKETQEKSGSSDMRFLEPPSTKLVVTSVSEITPVKPDTPSTDTDSVEYTSSDASDIEEFYDELFNWQEDIKLHDRAIPEVEVIYDRKAYMDTNVPEIKTNIIEDSKKSDTALLSCEASRDREMNDCIQFTEKVMPLERSDLYPEKDISLNTVDNCKMLHKDSENYTSNEQENNEMVEAMTYSRNSRMSFEIESNHKETLNDEKHFNVPKRMNGSTAVPNNKQTNINFTSCISLKPLPETHAEPGENSNSIPNVDSDNDRRKETFADDLGFPKDPRYCDNSNAAYAMTCKSLLRDLERATFGVANPSKTGCRGYDIVSYHNSEPLIKTYMIKMLFLFLKTAFADVSDWKEDQLSSLFKTSLCVIYFAYCTKEKAILNFWFQDFIENRTRDSTSVDILYSLEQTAKYLKRKCEIMEVEVANTDK